MTALLTFIWLSIYQGEQLNNQENYRNAVRFHYGYTAEDDIHNPVFWGATVFLLATSFLTGLIGARKNRTVCMNCGNVEKLPAKKHLKAATAIVLLLVSTSVFSQHKHHRKYNFNSSHKGEHHYKNQSSYHAERYKYRKHRK